MMTRIQSDCHSGERRKRDFSLVGSGVDGEGDIGAFMSFAVSRREMDSECLPGAEMKIRITMIKGRCAIILDVVPGFAGVFVP